MSFDNHQKIILEKQIEQLKNVPERTAGAAAAGRAKFLIEASRLRKEPIRKQRTDIQRAWKFAMAFLLMVVILSAGGVGVVNAAQESLPGDTLYPVKLTGENFQLALTADSPEKIDLLMQFATTRVSEMVQLTDQNLPIPASTTERMEEHIRRAMVLAAGQNNETLQASLSRICTRLREQVILLNQVTGVGDGSVQQLQERLQEKIRFMDENMDDEEEFRRRMQHGEETHPFISPDGTSTSPEDGGGGPDNPDGSGSDPGGGSIPAGTPEPGKGQGPFGPSSAPSAMPEHKGP